MKLFHLVCCIMHWKYVIDGAGNVNKDMLFTEMKSLTVLVLSTEQVQPDKLNKHNEHLQ